MHLSFAQHSRIVAHQWYEITVTLFKVLIPALIVVRLLEQAGFVDLLAQLLAPLMHLIDLPPLAGLIWATAMLTNIYAGLVIMITYASDWTLAQVTCMGMLMLGAHNLLVEVSIARKAGCRILPQTLMRIVSAFLLAWLLSWYYADDAMMQQTHAFIWQPEVRGADWATWTKTQLASLFWTAVVIFVLVTALQILKVTGIERMLERALKPLLKLIGISQKALSMTLIGMTLGLAFGGGLLIREAEKGELTPREILSAISLLGLCHSLIEDTLLIALTGASLWAVVGYRLIWALLLIAIIARLIPLIPDKMLDRWFATSVVKEPTERVG